jgi:DNA-dependent protein kinase catalytic subunit
LDESWRFIRWIPQLVSFTETPIASYIFPTLLRIAQDYPKALYYPFQMSFEHYALKTYRLPVENRQVVDKILAMIKSDVAENFTFELRRLTDPDLMVKDFIDFTKVKLAEAWEMELKFIILNRQ